MNSTKKLQIFSSVVLASSLVVLASFAGAATFTPISRLLGSGDRGADVTNLQTFLASNSYIYPEALITGYYGPMTAKAVAQFQLSQDLPAIGVVGPMTMAKINSLIAAGYGLDVSGPSISSVSVQKTMNSAIVNWSTNELAKGKVYYSTGPITFGEAATTHTAPPIFSTVLSVDGPNALASQAISISSLQANTTYYYMIVSTDQSGNVSIALPSTFVTSI